MKLKLCPREPTAEMLEAGRLASWEHGDPRISIAELSWRAMHDAAPVIWSGGGGDDEEARTVDLSPSATPSDDALEKIIFSDQSAFALALLEVKQRCAAQLAQAVAAERRACARLCDDADKSTHPADLADAIRARSTQSS